MSKWSDDLLASIAEKNKKQDRRSCNLYLISDRYETFKAWCQVSGHTTSKVVDHLIDVFMKEIEAGKDGPVA